MHLNNWKARRAGGRITINALGDKGGQLFDSDGKPVKIVGVDVIMPRDGEIIAIDKNGEEHTLAA